MLVKQQHLLHIQTRTGKRLKAIQLIFEACVRRSDERERVQEATRYGWRQILTIQLPESDPFLLKIDAGITQSFRRKPLNESVPIHRADPITRSWTPCHHIRQHFFIGSPESLISFLCTSACVDLFDPGVSKVVRTSDLINEINWNYRPGSSTWRHVVSEGLASCIVWACKHAKTRDKLPSRNITTIGLRGGRSKRICCDGHDIFLS